MLAQLLAVLRKEIKHILEDTGTYRLILFMQAFTLLTGGYIDLTTKDLPVAIVDEDRSFQSRLLTQKIDATKTLKVAHVVDTTEEARRLMRAGRARVAVVIPPDYHEKQVKGSGATILAIVDGSDSSAANQALGALDGLGEAINVEADTAAAEKQPESLSLRALTLFNPQGRLALFLLPGLIGFVLTEIAGLASDSIMMELESETMVRLLMTPLNPTAFLLGKLIPYFVIGTADLALLLLALRWVFQVPIHGNVFVIFLAGVLFILTLLSLGVYLAASSGSAIVVAQKELFHFVLTVYLSGWTFPLTSLPKYLLPVSYALPATHIIAIMRGMAVRDARVLDLLPHFAYLAIVPVILMVLADIRFRKSLEEL